ncbi:nucleoside 2-deoxyribosyltransferase, partial [Hyaloraphidium curvatum]
MTTCVLMGDASSSPAQVQVYLAGPDVFLPDHAGAAASLKSMCAARGLDGLFPMDAVLVAPTARNIYVANVDMVRRADAVIANLDPFRGPGMDSGTAFEVGFAAALGKPVFAYLDPGKLPRSYALRCRAIDPDARERADGSWEDSKGLAIEHFQHRDGRDLEENLMICEAVEGVYSSFEEAADACARHFKA